MNNFVLILIILIVFLMCLSLLLYLFKNIFCKHHYENIAEISLCHSTNSLPYGIVYIQKCKTCSNIRKTKIKF